MVLLFLHYYILQLLVLDMAHECLYDAYTCSWADNNQPPLPSATNENNFRRDYITRMIKLPPVADDLNNEIFIFINNAVIAIAYLSLSALISPAIT